MRKFQVLILNEDSEPMLHLKSAVIESTTTYYDAGFQRIELNITSGWEPLARGGYE